MGLAGSTMLWLTTLVARAEVADVASPAPHIELAYAGGATPDPPCTNAGGSTFQITSNVSANFCCRVPPEVCPAVQHHLVLGKLEGEDRWGFVLQDSSLQSPLTAGFLVP